MKRFPLSALAILLTITLVTPSVFLIAPQKAHAIPVTVVGTIQLPTEIKTTIESTISAIRNTLTSISTYTSAVANVAMQVNAYVLQPLAYIMSGNLLKALTAGVVAFVNGKSNGTGSPQFVQDLQGHMQRVGDVQALAFFAQFAQNSNSPFAAAISSSLRNNYLQQTSMAGFFAANQCTLAQSSPNINSFLAGNWSQGGIGAWFALTTQSQNNPYMLYQNSQSQLASAVGSAQAARAATLSWGQGFLSWCGGSSQTGTSGYDAAEATNGVADTSYDTADAMGGGLSTASSAGVNPGDPCTNSDGTSGTIKTPGSVISATLNKALGADQDKLVQLGQLASEVNGILGNIATVMKTFSLASQILSLNSGGLFGIGQTSASNPTSRLIQYQTAPTLGVTQSSIYQNAATLPSSGADMSSQIAEYQSAWGAISTVANAASISVTALINSCADPATVAAARIALTNEISPVLAQAAAASTTIATATAMVQKVQSELNSNSDATADTSSYIADMQTLQTIPPTTSDVANAQQDAQTFGTATANPDGSLTVSADSLVDQMNLINTNAAALKNSTLCAPPAPTFDNCSTGGCGQGGN